MKVPESAFAAYNKSAKTKNLRGIDKKTKKKIKQRKHKLAKQIENDLKAKEESVLHIYRSKEQKDIIKKKKKKKSKKIIPEPVETEEIPELIEAHIDDDYPPQEMLFNDLDSIDFSTKAQTLLKWLINPVELTDFFENYWEKAPLIISRQSPTYYKQILTTSDIDLMLRENPLYFSRNVDMVTYKDGIRVTDNPVGRAKASIVWDAYSSGYSIRILNPQTYNNKLHMILSTLQEYFGAMVGVNVYLTPAGSQGFAPHYDDIEAFVVQLEGRKHWKLYKSKEESDNLARFSSKDFSRDDLGELISEVTLESGDILYFPRGTVHEAQTGDDMHSLHVTISTYQRTSYTDLLENILPEALTKASKDDIEFRKGLPIGFLKDLGIVNSEKTTKKRRVMLKTVQELMLKLTQYVDLDQAADKLGQKFVHDSMPPLLDLREKECSSKYDGETILNGKLVRRGEIDPDTKVRLLRYYCIRLVMENNEANVYYSTENSKVYHGEEEQFITIEIEMCPVIETLLHAYPKYISVEDLPHKDLGKKINLVTELWDYGILVTKEPLEYPDDDEEEDDMNGDDICLEEEEDEDDD